MHLKALIRTVAVCAAIYILIKLCLYLLSPFLVSFIISIIVEPLVGVMTDKFKFNHTVSIILALIFFCCISFSASYFLIHSIYDETLVIIKYWPHYYDLLNNFTRNIYNFLKDNFNIIIENQDAAVLNADRMLNELIKIFVYLKEYILKIIYSMPDIIMYISFSIIATFFIMRDKDKILRSTRKLLPAKAVNIASKLNKTVINILRTEFILVLISTIQFILGFIMLHIDYAVILGIIAGILDILPLVGPGILFIPWIIYSFACGKIIFAVSLLCLYIIIIITRQILETKLMSGRLDLHPLVILISIYIGLKFFGVLGAILGPVIAATLKMVYLESLD